jgi:hypothetical protein
MTVPTVACTNCGKPFTTDDLRGTNCKFCGTLLAHHARAQQQVAVINQMMVDRNGNGIPDAYEGIVANAQANAMNQAFGMNPYAPYGGGPPMGAPPGMGMNNPYGNPYAANAMVAQNVGRAMSRAMIMVVISILAITVLSIGLGMAMWMMH